MKSIILFLSLAFSPLLMADYGESGYQYPVLQGSDQDIEQHVNLALNSHKDLRGLHIQASVDNGQVTLNGTVKNSSQKIIAGTVASSVEGVSFVQNNLIITE